MESMWRSWQASWIVRQQIRRKKEIVEERKQKQYEDQVETWRKETDIKVDKKEWKKVDFEDQGVNVKQTATDSEK